MDLRVHFNTVSATPSLIYNHTPTHTNTAMIHPVSEGAEGNNAGPNRASQMISAATQPPEIDSQAASLHKSSSGLPYGYIFKINDAGVIVL